MKTFKGKAIYNPSGKAGEYSYWACNFYVGCSGRCTYCYCKKGTLAKTMGGDTPKLKACFKDQNHAYLVFINELAANLFEIEKHGLFLSFTTDPFLPETEILTRLVIRACMAYQVPVKILTKQTKWIFAVDQLFPGKKLIAFGFTLTGHDELEPGCSPNADRIAGMRKLHNAGFITFASIEPVIDLKSSMQMIVQSVDYCDHYKIGLESGKAYDKEALLNFIEEVNCFVISEGKTIYWKESLLTQAGIKRAELPTSCVDRDYNIFKRF